MFVIHYDVITIGKQLTFKAGAGHAVEFGSVFIQQLHLQKGISKTDKNYLIGHEIEVRGMETREVPE